MFDHISCLYLTAATRFRTGLEGPATFVASHVHWDENDNPDQYVYWLDKEGQLQYWWWGPRVEDLQPSRLSQLPLAHCVRLAMGRRRLVPSNDQGWNMDTWDLTNKRPHQEPLPESHTD